jgi:hypothetical protein
VSQKGWVKGADADALHGRSDWRKKATSARQTELSDDIDTILRRYNECACPESAGEVVAREEM